MNLDQTGIKYIPVGSWTMEVEGARKVEIAGKDDKCQLKAVFGRSMGDFFPIQLIYQGKTHRCLPYVTSFRLGMRKGCAHSFKEEVRKLLLTPG